MGEQPFRRILLQRSVRPSHRAERRELRLGRIPTFLPQAAADAPHLRQRDSVVRAHASVRGICSLGCVGARERSGGAAPHGGARDRHGDAHAVWHARAERPYRQGPPVAAGDMRVRLPSWARRKGAFRAERWRVERSGNVDENAAFAFGEAPSDRAFPCPCCDVVCPPRRRKGDVLPCEGDPYPQGVDGG